jgi:hypothetical protein
MLAQQILLLWLADVRCLANDGDAASSFFGLNRGASARRTNHD